MRFWCRWLQPTEDYRPLTDPPNEAILGWWCSGYRVGDKEETATLCSLVEAKDEETADAAILKDWPEALLTDASPVANDWRPGDRFPLSGWSRKRVEKTKERGGSDPSTR